MHRLLAALLIAVSLLASPALAQTASSARSGDPLAATRIPAPTGSGSVFIQKVQRVDSAGADSSGAAADQVQGNVAHGATDSGNPVKVGCYASNSSPTTISTGQRANLWCFLNGAAAVGIVNNGGLRVTVADTTSQDTNTVGVTGLAVSSYNLVYDPAGGQNPRMRGDTNGTFTVPTPTAVSGNALAPASTAVANSVQVVKASGGNLYGFNVTTAGTAGYVMVFNATSAPADGTVSPIICLPIAANTGVAHNFSMPLSFSTGITMVFSSTGCFTKTASGTAFLSGFGK